MTTTAEYAVDGTLSTRNFCPADVGENAREACAGPGFLTRATCGQIYRLISTPLGTFARPQSDLCYGHERSKLSARMAQTHPLAGQADLGRIHHDWGYQRRTAGALDLGRRDRRPRRSRLIARAARAPSGSVFHAVPGDRTPPAAAVDVHPPKIRTSNARDGVRWLGYDRPPCSCRALHDRVPRSEWLGNEKRPPFPAGALFPVLDSMPNFDGTCQLHFDQGSDATHKMLCPSRPARPAEPALL